MINDTTPTQGDDRLAVSVPEAAKLLGVSRTLAYELARRGDLPVLRLGGRLVVPRWALQEMLRGALSVRWQSTDQDERLETAPASPRIAPQGADLRFGQTLSPSSLSYPAVNPG